MEKEEFKQKFIETFNELIKKERRDISEEYKMENAKIMISLKKELDNEEVMRCYNFVISELLKQKLSIDYINDEMVSFLEESTIKTNALFLCLKAVKSRKPLKNKEKLLLTEKDIEEYKFLFAVFFNKKMKLHAGKINEYNTMDFTVSHGELFDKEFLYEKFKIISKDLGYKIYTVNPNLLEIDTIVPDEQYIVRYNYGE